MATQEDMKKTWNGESRGYEEDVEGRNKEDRKKTWNGESRGYKEEVDCCYDCSLVSCVLKQEAVYIAKWHKRTLTLLWL